MFRNLNEHELMAPANVGTTIELPMWKNSDIPYDISSEITRYELYKLINDHFNRRVEIKVIEDLLKRKSDNIDLIHLLKLKIKILEGTPITISDLFFTDKQRKIVSGFKKGKIELTTWT